jgi:peroxiredoxin
MRTCLFALTLCTLIATPALAGDAPEAPGFSLTDQSGKTVKLSDSDGSIRVLEWVNPDCPFVKRHYTAGTMKQLAKKYADKGVVWLTINSTHYMDREANAAFHKAHSLPYPVLVDADGAVGHAYDAKTTPHMYIVDGKGRIVYQGAIDDDPRGSKDTVENYVSRALDELIAGKPVSNPETKPYGCSVKYKK